MWLSLVERLLWEQDAAGSNPVIRTKKEEHLKGDTLPFCVCMMGFLCSILVQRSIKSIESVSPMILSGTANRRCSRRSHLFQKNSHRI